MYFPTGKWHVAEWEHADLNVMILMFLPDVIQLINQSVFVFFCMRFKLFLILYLCTYALAV